jgi:hypothetical protein
MAQGSLDDFWEQGTAAIKEIDEKLDSLDDSASASKRVLINQFIETNKDFVEKNSGMVVNQIRSIPDQEDGSFEKLVAMYTGLRRALDAAFQKEIDEQVQKLVENQPKREPLITAEEAVELTQTRSDLRKKLATLREVIIGFGEEDEAAYVLPPVRRTGAKGKRGKRQISFYTWTVDGEVIGETLAEVVKSLDFFDKVTQLRAFLEAAGINVKKPATEILEAELPNGKILIGTRDPDAPPIGSDDEEVENGEDEEDDEEDDADDE